jgi:hypothetical protein
LKGWKKIYHENENQKLARVAIFTSDEKGFESKIIKRNKITTQ